MRRIIQIDGGYFPIEKSREVIWMYNWIACIKMKNNIRQVSHANTKANTCKCEKALVEWEMQKRQLRDYIV
jgi:hypothetical protein